MTAQVERSKRKRSSKYHHLDCFSIPAHSHLLCSSRMLILFFPLLYPFPLFHPLLLIPSQRKQIEKETDISSEWRLQKQPNRKTVSFTYIKKRQNERCRPYISNPRACGQCGEATCLTIFLLLAQRATFITKSALTLPSAPLLKSSYSTMTAASASTTPVTRLPHSNDALPFFSER